MTQESVRQLYASRDEMAVDVERLLKDGWVVKRLTKLAGQGYEIELDRGPSIAFLERAGSSDGTAQPRTPG